MTGEDDVEIEAACGLPDHGLDLAARGGKLLFGRVATAQQDLELRRDLSATLPAMNGRDVEARGERPGCLRRWRQGRRPLRDHGLQAGERSEDRIGAGAALLAGMGRLAAHAHRQREQAEAAGPDSRHGAAVEVQNVPFEASLLCKIADARIEPGLLVRAQQQHRIISEH